MPLDFSRLVGPLTVSQYVSRLKWAAIIAFPITYGVARWSQRNDAVAPIIDNRLQPVYDQGVRELWEEQVKVLTPYWNDSSKRKNLSVEQRTELDLLRSLSWHVVPEKVSYKQEKEHVSVVAEGRVKLDKDSSFYSI